MIELALVMHGVVTQYPSADHPAWDIACRTGRPVHAVIDGKLTTKRNGRMGNMVIIEGPQGRTLYAHLQTVTEPRQVVSGEVVGTCGSTGSWSTGPHVHVEYTPPD